MTGLALARGQEAREFGYLRVPGAQLGRCRGEFIGVVVHPAAEDWVAVKALAVLAGHLTPEELYLMLIEVLEARNASLEGRLINFRASWPDFCARRDDTLFTSDNVTSFGSGFGLAA